LGILLAVFWKPYAQWRTSGDSSFKSHGISLKIKRGVFHPGFFESTKVLLNFINSLEIKDKTLLELGAGSGLISFVAAKRGAKVTALDINPNAIAGLIDNARSLGFRVGFDIEIVQSDLFSSIKPQNFDYIVINPPFYRGEPISVAEYAWYAGPELQYFTRLFCDISKYIGSDTEVLMVFADIPELEIVKKIAFRADYSLECILRKKSLFQDQLVFKLEPLKNMDLSSNASC
jgi:release factor glutamine methyltransferase